MTKIEALRLWRTTTIETRYKGDLARLRELRVRTGGAFFDCHRALVASGDDLDSAVEILQVAGLAVAIDVAARRAASDDYHRRVAAALPRGVCYACDAPLVPDVEGMKLRPATAKPVVMCPNGHGRWIVARKEDAP